MNTSAVPAQLTNNLAAAADELRDIKPPVVIPSGWIWVGLAVAVVVGLIAAIVLFIWFVRRLRMPPQIPVVLPHTRARQKLQAALELIDQPKLFCILVSDAVRVYLEERFGLRAPDRTTEEFLAELAGSGLLTEQQKATLQEFLSACDLVKFARYEPGPPELKALHHSALRLVEETEPRPEPIQAPPVDAPQNPQHVSA